MSDIYRIFCDESCHLENDRQPYMVLGGLIVEDRNYKNVIEDITTLKRQYKLGTEFKWTKVSKSRL